MRLSCLWWSVLLWSSGTDLVNAEDQIQHRKLVRASLGNAISDRYIVILNGKVADVISKAKSLLQDSDATIDFEYDTVFKGFAVNGLVAKFLTIILDDDMVLSVEEDAVVTEDASFQYTQTSPPNWGLDRIDQINRSFNNIYGYTYTGKGVYIFTIDSGINLSHNEFTGRAYCGYSVISGENCDDYRGHGSHVAGIAGGTTYGVAKEAYITSIKVLDRNGDGSSSGVIMGLEYVAKLKAANKSTPMVANMSLGGSKSSSINAAVASAISIGLVIVTSAGNDGFDACNKSPASVGTAITVAATDNDDSRSSFSNYGSCVDIFAPGRSITSAWYTSSTASKSLSGTSMATPFVTGVAALYLQRDPSMTPQQVQEAMVADGATGLVPNRSGSPNVIVSTAALTGSVPTAPVSSAASPVRAPTAPVRAPTAPVRTPTAPVRTPTAPVRTPTAPVRTPTAPVRTPTAPVRTPTAPVRTPTAPVPRPATPVRTPVRGSPTSNDNDDTTKTCRYFLGSCSSSSDCCSNKCRRSFCFPF